MKGFSYPYNPEIHAAARGTGLNVSPKAAREVCHALKGMELEKAKNYLERVIDLEQAVPFKRHDGKVGHRKGKGMSSGRFPVKTAAAILKVIESAGNNGEALHTLILKIGELYISLHHVALGSKVDFLELGEEQLQKCAKVLTLR